MEMISTKRLHADPRSANVMTDERRAKLRANIEYHQHVPPLIVRPHPKKKQHHMVIDGHQRLRVLTEMGWSELPCMIWDVDEQQAGLLLATLNRLRGEDHPHKRAELIEGLLTHFNKAQLVELLPETQAQIDDLLLLLKQQEQSLQDVMKAYQEREKQALPEVITFVLTQDEAQLVKSVLDRRDAENPNHALVLLCQEVDGNDHDSR